MNQLLSKRPRVSIGISFFNDERTLAWAIRSVFAQTYDDWELILVDDGSTDRSLEIASSVTDSRVRVVSNLENRGIPYCLNQIGQLSRGEYISRMDGDDMMHAERIALQVRFLDENRHVDVVDTAMYSIDNDNRPIGVRGLVELNNDPCIVLKKGFVMHSTITGKRSWFLENPQLESFLRVADHELWCRTCQSSSFARIQKALYFYRECGVNRLQKTFLDLAFERKIMMMYGPSFSGWPSTLLQIMRTFVKAGAFSVFFLIGAQDFLLQKRNTALSEYEKQEALSAIARVLQTKVPGLVDSS